MRRSGLDEALTEAERNPLGLSPAQLREAETNDQRFLRASNIYLVGGLGLVFVISCIVWFVRRG